MLKKTSKLAALFFAFALLFLQGCTKNTQEETRYLQNSEQVVAPHYVEDTQLYETSEIASPFPQYDSVCYYDISNSEMYSAEIIDSYFEKNILLECAQIVDIYYENEKIYMCASCYGLGTDMFILEISRDHYEKLKKSDNRGRSSSINVIFKLSSIETNYPGIYLYNYNSFNFDENDDVYMDWDWDENFSVRVFKGTLIDIELN